MHWDEPLASLILRHTAVSVVLLGRVGKRPEQATWDPYTFCDPLEGAHLGKPPASLVLGHIAFSDVLLEGRE